MASIEDLTLDQQATFRSEIGALKSEALAVTTLLQGAAAVPTKIGAEFLPVTQVIDSDIPNTLTITGITDPVASDPLTLTRSSDSSGFATWTNGNWRMYHESTNWQLKNQVGLGLLYYAQVVSSAKTPEGLSLSDVSFGAGAAVVAGDSTVLSNASVNAAIATDPAATRTAAGAMANTNAAVNVALAVDPAASRAALGGVITEAASAAIQVPVESLPSAILVHDDCSGVHANYALAATRAVSPGPGTMTVGALPSTSLVRYEHGELLLTPMPAGSGGVAVHYGGVTAAAGLTMIARVVPAFTPGRLAQTRVGFSHASNGSNARRGHVLLADNDSPYSSGGVYVSVLATDVDSNDYPVEKGVYNYGDELAIAVHYKTLSHQQYWIQGGKYASSGCTIGSNNWHLLAETFTTIPVELVYPTVSCNFNHTARIRDVKVLSSWSPSPRHRSFDYNRVKIGIHIPSIGTDPVTGAVIMAWNNSTAHTGTDLVINYSAKLPDGTWTPSANLIPAPGGGAGISIGALSQVNGVLRLHYWVHPTAADGGTLYWRTVSVNATTGVATLGAQTLMNIDGALNLSFTRIVQLPSGRLMLFLHRADLLSYYTFSDDNGTTWSTVALITATANLAEPTVMIESDGALGCYMRSMSLAVPWSFYSRCANPDAATPTWSAAVPVYSIPQPETSGYTSGARLQALRRDDGRMFVVGNDSGTLRRNLTVWEVGDNAQILGSTFIADYGIPTATTATSIAQYPAIHEDGEDMLIAYSHNQQGTAGVASGCAIRLHTMRWPEPVAVEAGGSGVRTKKTEPARRTLFTTVSLVYSAAPVPDMSLGNLFDLRLTASGATVGAPLNPLPWETLTLVVSQAGTGSYTLAFNAVFEFNGTTPTLRTAVNASNIFIFRYNGYTNKWVLESFN